MSVEIVVGVATAIAIVFVLPKGVQRPPLQNEEVLAGPKLEHGAINEGGAALPPQPVGVEDFDEYRARKSRVRTSFDAILFFVLCAAALYVLSRDYNYRPLSLLKQSLPREARLLEGLIHGLANARGDGVAWVRQVIAQYFS